MGGVEDMREKKGGKKAGQGAGFILLNLRLLLACCRFIHRHLDGFVWGSDDN